MPPPPWGHGVDPGFVPLRPLRLGEIFGLAAGTVRRHARIFLPRGLLVAVVAAAVQIGLLAQAGWLTDYASGEMTKNLLTVLQDPSQRIDIPLTAFAAGLGNTAVLFGGVLLLSAAVMPWLAMDAVTRTPTPTQARDAHSRSSGRWGVAASAVVLITVAFVAGSALLIIPGVIAFAIWAVAGPVAVMEQGGAASPLARSAALTRGHRWRIVGVTGLAVLLAGLAQAVASGIISASIDGGTSITAMWVAEVVNALVSAATLPWVATIIALLYMDLRIRKENLATALRHASRAA